MSQDTGVRNKLLGTQGTLHLSHLLLSSHVPEILSLFTCYSSSIHRDRLFFDPNSHFLGEGIVLPQPE